MGSVWHPPYAVDVTTALHPGDNSIELQVANTALNVFASQPPTDYTALNAKYGVRFNTQYMEDVKPIPSGITGSIHLTETR